MANKWYIYICIITLLHIHLQHQHITTSAADVPPYPKVLGLHHIPGTSLPADRGLCREPSHECFMLFPDVGNCCMVPMASGVVLMTFPCFSKFSIFENNSKFMVCQKNGHRCLWFWGIRRTGDPGAWRQSTPRRDLGHTSGHLGIQGPRSGKTIGIMLIRNFSVQWSWHYIMWKPIWRSMKGWLITKTASVTTWVPAKVRCFFRFESSFLFGERHWESVSWWGG